MAILQRVCTPYRLELFRELSDTPDLTARVFVGDDLPDSKVQNAKDLSGVDVVRLRTRLFGAGRKTRVDHPDLVAELRRFSPHVILCEGDSHVLGYLRALWYRRRRPATGLIVWTLGRVPGGPARTRCLKSRLKSYLFGKADAVVTYSSFGKERLVDLGLLPERIFTAVNVCATAKHRELAESIGESKCELRRRLGLPDRFTIVSVGSMDPDKRLDVLLRAACRLESSRYNFVFVGNGVMLESLKALAEQQGLDNAHFPGRIERDLPRYYKASDVLVVPGRGGMVISEAMAYGLPVIVHQADGTEYDLVRERATGIRVDHGNPSDFADAIRFLCEHPSQAEAWGERAKKLIESEFSQTQMVARILDAIAHARRARQGRKRSRTTQSGTGISAMHGGRETSRWR
ncbi:glycosyltransferase family 4 protein [Planctomycetota bacterium]